MAATSRRSRSYKDRGSGFTFGHFALPIAAVIALVLLFVGIKLFFLMPVDRIEGIEVISPSIAEENAQNSLTAAPIAPEPEFAERESASPAGPAGHTAADGKAGESMILAGPIAPNGTPVRASSSTQAKGVSARPADAKEKTPAASNPAKQRQTANAAAGASGKWAVQIGAFVKREGASTLQSEVEKQGYAASISKVDSSGKTFHRVRVSAGNSREAAAELAAELERKGYPVAVVPLP
ncbi:MAG: SPOR domain-containing protein [Synergistaceae bacterium]|jgi:DedD protein|nr:SPOR domain-containing protein [Synergistaceae bacterium]